MGKDTKVLSKKSNKKKDFNKFSIGVLIFLSLYALLWIIMFLWGIETSLKSEDDFMVAHNVLGFPSLSKTDIFHSRDEFFHLENYKKVFELFVIQTNSSYYFNGELIMKQELVNMGQMAWNTVLYAGGIAIFQTIVPAIVAYLCAKYRYKFNEWIIGSVFLAMTLPMVVATPAIISIQQKLGLYDTIIGQYLQNIDYTGTYFLIYLAFFRGLPDTYSEAAEMDGATQYTVLFRIVLPLSLTILGTVYLLKFISLWNLYQPAMLLIPSYPTLAVGVFTYVNKGGTNTVPLQVAGCMLLAFPILLLFIIFKDKIMGNLTLGGTKE